MLVFAPWVFVKRNRSTALLLILPIAVFLWFYGALWLPKGQQTESPAESLTVVTHNLSYTNDEYDAFLTMVEVYDPDLLALQEVTNSRWLKLNSALAERYTYASYYEPAGLGIYSQFPILSQEIYPSAQRPIQIIEIKIHGRLVQVENAHLAEPGLLRFIKTQELSPLLEQVSARTDQAISINRSINKTSLPVIMACDCNMTNLNSTYKQITNHLRDAFAERGSGLGHTFLIPRGFEVNSKYNLAFQRIDYIFHSSEIRVTQVHVLRVDTGSDHYPLWGQFELLPEMDQTKVK